MYETEANGLVESAESIPPEAVAGFAALGGKIVSRTVFPWSEHCTECVWPTCYKTCELYSPREDGRCRRFVDGMVRVECPDAVNGYILKIRFKRWAKLWTTGSMRLHPDSKARRIEKRDHQLGTMLYRLALPRKAKTTIITKRYSLKKRVARLKSRQKRKATSFVLECFNPLEKPVDLSLTIRSAMKDQKIPYQMLIRLSPGFHVTRIPVARIEQDVDLAFPFTVEVIPGGFEQEVTLYFGLMDFIEETHPPADQSPAFKCVVWDLDHTLWNGILVEDGAANLVLKPGIVEIIEALDQRGILQSIASKNHYSEAIDVLRKFGIDQYFLYPQISWSPKSEAVKNIVRQLNIGIDTVMLVDDQEFERAQVSLSAPGVRTFDSRDYQHLLDMKECQVAPTEESRNRRKMYQVEQERRELQASFNDDYKAFLKHCQIRLNISRLDENNLERVHELTQRTNQMNFSGNRYDRSVLREMIESPHLDTYVLECEDRFGSYGIVGFSVVDSREPRMTDLMFSCRIQSKRVEHAFLAWVIGKYIRSTGSDFHADYRKTTRNAPTGQVFDDVGMIPQGTRDGVTSLLFSHDCSVPDEDIVRIEIGD